MTAEIAAACYGARESLDMEYEQNKIIYVLQYLMGQTDYDGSIQSCRFGKSQKRM